VDEIGGTGPTLTDADEDRHGDAAVEAWWWWGSGAQADGRPAGLFVGLELRGRRFDYWAGLVREGEPYLYIEELDGTGLRDGLEIKPPQMWAGHDCDVPFRQWSIGNEAHGVLLDDPTEAWRRAHGTPVPVTFDVEWHAVSAAAAIDGPLGAGGYRQLGEIDARIELLDGVFALTGPGERVHVWGVPYLPSSFAMPNDLHDLRAPYRRSDGVRVDQVLTVGEQFGTQRWVRSVSRGVPAR
jgi:hypothetical protein